MFICESISKLFKNGIQLHDPDGRAVETSELLAEYRSIRTYIAHSVQEGDVVAINLKYGYKYLLCIYACMEIGRPFVPLRSTWPSSRVEQIRTMVGFDLYLTEDRLSEALKISGDDDISLSQLDESKPIYYIFTSGSSGAPKGVEISRGAFEHFVRWIERNFDVPSKHRMLFVADFTFDMSMLDVARLMVNPCQAYFSKFTYDIFQLAAEVDEYRINSIATIPNTIDMLLREGVVERVDLSNLNCLLLGGSRFSYAVYRRIFEKFGAETDVYNFYGPTEATVYTHVCKLTGDPNEDTLDQNVTIGVPFEGLKAKLLDRDRKEIVDVNYVGELHLGGPQVMTGYVENKEQTELVLSEVAGTIFYKTGDLSFLDENGRYFIVGRVDETIKRRGFRINLLDIESYICSIDGVDDCVVVAVPDEKTENILFAYLILSEQMEEGKVRTLMKEVLVDYQIPDNIVFTESYPRNNSGKISRRNLEKLSADMLANEK